MRCVVWTGVYAAGFLQVRAKIAGGCLLLDDRLLAAGILRIVRKNFEGMQIDIAVGAIPRAEPAADAPILDDDFERIAATDGANGAPDHAKRVAALAATRGHEIALKAQPVAHQTRSEEHTSELQSRLHLVCRLLLEKTKDPFGRVSGVVPGHVTQ